MWTRTTIIAIVVIANYLNASDANHGIAKRDTGESDTIEQKIRNKLEQLRAIMPTGHKASAIPILDPYFISNTSLLYENKIVRVKFEVENITLSGIKDFIVDHLSVRLFPTQINFNFSVPNIILEVGKYALNGKLFKFIPIFGNGNVVVRLRNFNVQGYTTVSLKEKYLKMTSIKLNGCFAKFYFSISGFLKSQFVSKIVSILITKIVPIVFNEYKEAIWHKIEYLGLELGNELIKDVTFAQVLDVLENNNEFIPGRNTSSVAVE